MYNSSVYVFSPTKLFSFQFYSCFLSFILHLELKIRCCKGKKETRKKHTHTKRENGKILRKSTQQPSEISKVSSRLANDAKTDWENIFSLSLARKFLSEIRPKAFDSLFFPQLMYNFTIQKYEGKKWKYVNIFLNSSHVFFSVNVPLSLLLAHFYVVSVFCFSCLSFGLFLIHSFISFENWKKTLHIHSLNSLHTPNHIT